MDVRVVRGVPSPGYRWWTVGVWRWGLKAGPVTVQIRHDGGFGPDISILSSWRVICR